MFDTNVFNKIIKNSIKIEFPKKYQFFVTIMQRDEISKTQNIELRKKLESEFKTINEDSHAKKAYPETSPWGILPWGEFKYGADGGHYEHLKNELADYPNKAKDRGNPIDALLIETCLLNNIIFVTEDAAIQHVCKNNGVNSMSLEQFINLIKTEQNAT